MKIIIILFITLVIPFITLLPQQNKKGHSMIEKSVFGKMKDGKEVYMYTLKNKPGAEVKIITYGATVVSLTTPDRNGKYADVALGYDSLVDYEIGTAYLGATAGRYANRIADAKFTLDGKTYLLSANEGKNQLHGGKIGFSKDLWESDAFESKLGPAVKLTLVSPDGDQGYPGTVTLQVTYTLTNSNELRIDYKGTTDKPTILNPTNHTYFNLTGVFTNTILNHEVKINAEYYTPIDKESIPTGKIDKVENTPLDFRKLTTIGSRINDDFEQLKLANGYDFNYVLNNYNGKVREVADVYEPTTGRYLQIFTDQPGLQFYTGNFLNGTPVGKDGVAYQFRTGFAMESEHYPNSPNEPKWPSVVLRPGQTYKQTTIYKFSAK
ncbi:MAG: aldose epimerase family protein [Ignavibacteriaceae bacterium]